MINFVTQVVNPEKRLHSDLIALANCKRNNLASIDFCFRQLFTGSLGNTSLKITVFPEVKFVPVLKKSKTVERCSVWFRPKLRLWNKGVGQRKSNHGLCDPFGVSFVFVASRSISRVEVLCFGGLDQKMVCFVRVDPDWIFFLTDLTQAVFLSNIFDRGRTFRPSSTEEKQFDRGFFSTGKNFDPEKTVRMSSLE